MTAESAARSWHEYMDHLKAVQEGRKSPEDQEQQETVRTQRRYSYYLVDISGGLHFQWGTLREKYKAISEGYGVAGESETMWTNLFPLAAYDFVRNGIPEDRRRNTVANALMWELTGPLELYNPTGEDGTVDAVPAQAERVKAKMRGPVVFHNPGLNIADWQHDTVREAHQTAVAKLRAKGWI